MREVTTAPTGVSAAIWMGHGALKLAVRPPEGMWPDGADLEVPTRPQQGRPQGAMKIATDGPSLLRNVAGGPQGQMPELLMWNTGTIFVRGAVAPRKLLEAGKRLNNGGA